MTELDNQAIETDLTPKRLAFIVDGKVVDILQTDERLAAIFLSQPEIKNITEEFENSKIASGFVYNLELEKFVPEKPFASWIFNNELHDWRPPVAFPLDYTEDSDFYYSWNEEIVNWEQVAKSSVDQA
jgi:hypothetical protein